ncbi:hypothetical protein NB689_001656 [Xanthomonas sacchari]|nr:hypothetical protein [Xanthomonas sacchari]
MRAPTVRAACVANAPRSPLVPPASHPLGCADEILPIFRPVRRRPARPTPAAVPHAASAGLQLGDVLRPDRGADRRTRLPVRRPLRFRQVHSARCHVGVADTAEHRRLQCGRARSRTQRARPQPGVLRSRCLGRPAGQRLGRNRHAVSAQGRHLDRAGPGVPRWRGSRGQPGAAVLDRRQRHRGRRRAQALHGRRARLRHRDRPGWLRPGPAQAQAAPVRRASFRQLLRLRRAFPPPARHRQRDGAAPAAQDPVGEEPGRPQCLPARVHARRAQDLRRRRAPGRRFRRARWRAPGGGHRTPPGRDAGAGAWPPCRADDPAPPTQRTGGTQARAGCLSRAAPPGAAGRAPAGPGYARPWPGRRRRPTPRRAGEPPTAPGRPRSAAAGAGRRAHRRAGTRTTPDRGRARSPHGQARSGRRRLSYVGADAGRQRARLRRAGRAGARGAGRRATRCRRAGRGHQRTDGRQVRRREALRAGACRDRGAQAQSVQHPSADAGAACTAERRHRGAGGGVAVRRRTDPGPRRRSALARRDRARVAWLRAVAAGG